MADFRDREVVEGFAKELLTSSEGARKYSVTTPIVFNLIKNSLLMASIWILVLSPRLTYGRDIFVNKKLSVVVDTDDRNKINFNTDVENKERKFIDLAWDLIAIPEYGSTSNALKYGISRNKITIAITDLDDDGKDDAVILLGKDYCGSDGCSINIIKGDNNKVIDFCMSIQLSSPIYILESKSNGMRELMVNDKQIIKYNGKAYCR